MRIASKGCFYELFIMNLFQVPGPLDPMYRALPPCPDRQFNDNPLEVLLRTSRTIPALTSIFTLATAYHKAWESKCNGSSGICPQLREMKRKEFVSQFLEPVEYIVGKAEEEYSKKRAPREAEKLEGNKLALTTYGFDEQKKVHFKQVSRIKNLI